MRPVLDALRALSGEITIEGTRLCASLDELIKDLDLAVFNLSAAKLQIELTARFAHELVDHASMGGLNDSTDSMTEGAIGNLHASSCQTVRKALSGLASIKERLKT